MNSFVKTPLKNLFAPLFGVGPSAGRGFRGTYSRQCCVHSGGDGKAEDQRREKVLESFVGGRKREAESVTYI